MTLDDILDAARQESEERQRTVPLAVLKREVGKKGVTRGFARALRQRRFGVIAEIKYKSPSMGSISRLAIEHAASVYHSHPLVAAISVLTQTAYFGGTMKHLADVRQKTQCRPKPILRKDFISEEYEVYFSRWIGADAILLMANVVTDRAKFKALHDLALDIGLDVLCEIHDEAEIDLLPDTAQICGINSRRFKGVNQKKTLGLRVRELLVGDASRDTQTDLAAFNLFNRLPSQCLKVAESGISIENIGSVLGEHPFNAALVGTSLLRAGHDMKAHLDRIQYESERALDGNQLALAENVALAR